MAHVGHETTRTGETIYTAPDVRDERIVDEREDRLTTEVWTGGTSLEAAGGAVGALLSVIGLVGAAPLTLASLATIAIGAALAAHGGALTARWNDTSRRFTEERYNEVLGGVGSEVFAGPVGMVLGVLALIGVAPGVLLPVAAIVYGGSLLLGGSIQPEFGRLVGDVYVERASLSLMELSGGAMVVVGIGAGVLGILAVVGIGSAITMTLVAMLAIGAVLALAGGTTASRLWRRLT